MSTTEQQKAKLEAYANEPKLWVVTTTDPDTTWYDIVEMSENQARKMMEELEAAKDRRRISDYMIWDAHEGVRKHNEYASFLTQWLSRRIPGETKPTKAQRMKNEAAIAAAAEQQP